MLLLKCGERLYDSGPQSASFCNLHFTNKGVISKHSPTSTSTSTHTHNTQTQGHNNTSNYSLDDIRGCPFGGRCQMPLTTCFLTFPFFAFVMFYDRWLNYITRNANFVFVCVAAKCRHGLDQNKKCMSLFSHGVSHTYIKTFLQPILSAYTVAQSIHGY